MSFLPDHIFESSKKGQKKNKKKNKSNQKDPYSPFRGNNVSSVGNLAMLSNKLSTLQLFRMSPLYKALMTKRKTNKSQLLVQSADYVRANLIEQAKNWVSNTDRLINDFSSAVIGKTVDVGLDRALVDADQAKNSLTMYFSDKLGRLFKDIPNLLATVGNATLESSPDGNNQGLYVYEVAPLDGADYESILQKLLGRVQSNDPDTAGTENEQES